MAGIKNCIAKFKDFPNSLKNRLISLSDSFKEQGKSDLEADTEALHEVHKELHDELNDLKRQVKVPVKKYSRPDTQKEVEKVKEKHKKEDDDAAAAVSENEKTEVVKTNGPIKDSKTDVVPIRNITTDESSFQNREKLNEAVVKNIAENFDANQFDPIVVWKNNDKLVVLAGHHRLAGAKLAGVPSVPVRYFEGTKEEAVKYAKELSNANRSMESPVERAKIYRKKLKDGQSKKSVEEEAQKNENKNASFVLNIAALNPDGPVVQAINSFEGAEDKVTQRELDRMADWIGDARRSYHELTDAHEKEMFDFLMDADSSKRLKTKSDFKQKITAIAGGIEFDKDKPLNLFRFKYKTEGEKAYDADVLELQQKISETNTKIEETRDRFNNPLNEKYINPNSQDYDEVKKRSLDIIDENLSKLKDFQKDLLELYRNKGKYVSGGSNQGALFQKKTEPTKAQKADVDKVMERMKKVLPKFNIVYNKDLDAAGKIDGNKIEINPFYAGTDTPIHEVGHALIDFIGYKNRVIQAGIRQLKGTQLYKGVAAARPELEGELLDKEVLAEAIGKEGAGIFDSEAQKSRFKQVLDYIFTKLKQLLGIDKNIAKSLAKQIIGGIGTKEITDANESLQKSKKLKDIELTEAEEKVQKLYKSIKDIEDLSAVPWKDMLAAYNYLITTENYSQTAEGKRAAKEFLKRMGISFFQEYSDKVKTDPKYSPEKAAKKDIKGWDVAMKALSHFTAEFPELKGLSELYNEAFFNKITESAEKKRINEKLAEAVIKDRHQRLGIAERVKEGVFNLFGNRNYKYFDFLEGKDGNFITVKEAEKKGLSKAQIDYLKFARNVVASREAVVDNLGENWNNELQILRNDKKFYESFATENVVSAFSSLLGNTWNINNVRIEFTNPETGKEQTTEYENIEKILVKYGKKGVLQKANAIRLIAKYNVRARSQLAENVNRDEKGDSNVLNAIRSGDYSLTTNGKLQSKFDKPRNPSRPYSKDFYSAINEYIDDTEHIQHMQPLVPIINAIDYLNKGVYDSDGNEIHYKKKNVTDWLKDWSDFHILKKPAPVILGKYESERAALALRFFRNAASLTMMMFNVPAQLRNAAMGIYNTWRKENGATVARGMKRVFGGKKGYDIIKKYKASSTDIDSNPIVSAGGAITSLGYALTKWGEFLVQGSQFLGMMDEKDYNSFEYKKNKFGVDELVVKQGVDEKALQKRMLDLVDRVSDVQGKYSEKDRRNIQNNELGKSIMQYRVWLPDWWRIRFSKDAGSWRNMFSGEVKEMKKQISEKGVVKAFWEDKNFMSNFKEVSMITLLLALLYSDDEDEEKSMASKQAMKVLSEMVGVVDPNNMKQIIERPVASMGVVTRVLDAFDHLIMLEADDFYKKDSKYGKKGDPKIIGDIRGAIPGKQAIDLAEEALEDED